LKREARKPESVKKKSSKRAASETREGQDPKKRGIERPTARGAKIKKGKQIMTVIHWEGEEGNPKGERLQSGTLEKRKDEIMMKSVGLMGRLFGLRKGVIPSRGCKKNGEGIEKRRSGAPRLVGYSEWPRRLESNGGTAHGHYE